MIIFAPKSVQRGNLDEIRRAKLRLRPGSYTMETMLPISEIRPFAKGFDCKFIVLDKGKMHNRFERLVDRHSYHFLKIS